MKYFTLAELTRSDTAERLGIDNTPSAQATTNLRRLTERTLDRAREQFGHPIYVNSGYRSAALNKVIGGARHSYHMQGRAADLDTHTGDNRRLYGILQKLPHTELIWENHGQWIHVAL